MAPSHLRSPFPLLSYLPLPGSHTTPLPRRRHLFLPPSATPSGDTAPPPARRSSHPDKASGEGEWWRKAVPPGRAGPPAPSPRSRCRRPGGRPCGRRALRGGRPCHWCPALLNLLVLIFASTISIVKEAPTMLDPDLLNITRFTIAAIPFVLFLLKSIRDMQVVIRGVELGIWVTLAYLTQSIGLVTADAGRASSISALTVIIVPFLDGILGAEIPAYT
uniref:EamA domain-containing protein n=1 Tax=Hordeum vulgare subsp. vulgare TaxID=112509 RepID=A0A8I6Z7N2_HORVV